MAIGLWWVLGRVGMGAASFAFCMKEGRSPHARFRRGAEKVFVTACAIGALAAYTLGTHAENDGEPPDPLRGGGDDYTVVDFVPSAGQRWAAFADIFAVLAVPGLFGMAFGLRSRDAKAVADSPNGSSGPITGLVMGLRDLMAGRLFERRKAEGRERMRRHIESSLEVCDWPPGSRSREEVALARANVLEHYIRGRGVGREVALELQARFLQARESSETGATAPSPTKSEG